MINFVRGSLRNHAQIELHRQATFFVNLFINVINAAQGNSHNNYHMTECTRVPRCPCYTQIDLPVLTWVLQQQESLPRGRGFLSGKRSWRCEG